MPEDWKCPVCERGKTPEQTFCAEHEPPMRLSYAPYDPVSRPNMTTIRNADGSHTVPFNIDFTTLRESVMARTSKTRAFLARGPHQATQESE